MAGAIPKKRRDTYNVVSGEVPFDFYGFKLWYQQDVPLMTPEEVVALSHPRISSSTSRASAPFSSRIDLDVPWNSRRAGQFFPMPGGHSDVRNRLHLQQRLPSTRTDPWLPIGRAVADADPNCSIFPNSGVLWRVGPFTDPD